MSADAASPGARLEAISEEECRQLLAATKIGRVAVTVGAVPAIFPVNHAVLDGAVVFRTSDGTKLDAALRGTVVAFEVDEADPDKEVGWSVVVVGVAGQIHEPDDRARARALNLRPWAPGERDHYVRILPEMISGRRIIPRSVAAPASEVAGVGRDIGASSGGGFGSSVLLVEDTTALRESLAEIIHHAGYSVLQARDGEEALRLLANQPVAAMVLDMHLPGRDGFGVLEALDAPPPVIAITGFSLDPDERNRLESLVAIVLLKPFDPARLLRNIAELISANSGS